MIRSKFIFFITFLTFSCSLLFSQENEIMMDSIPFGAIIQSELGGKRSKFYGNTRFTLNQAYFSNWISGGESSITDCLEWIIIIILIEMINRDTNFVISLATYNKRVFILKKQINKLIH